MWSPFTNLPLPHFLHPEEEVGGPLGDGDGTGQSEGTSGLGWSSIRLAPCGQYQTCPLPLLEHTHINPVQRRLVQLQILLENQKDCFRSRQEPQKASVVLNFCRLSIWGNCPICHAPGPLLNTAASSSYPAPRPENLMWMAWICSCDIAGVDLSNPMKAAGALPRVGGQMSIQ